MATLTLGYKIWDSVNLISCCSANSGSGDPADVVQCFEGWNPRGAQLIPYVNCDTGTIRWDLNDNITEYSSSVAGVRNGIAVTNPETGVITVWDVLGGGTETPAEKLLAFLPICNCTDCTGDLEILQGEYECDYDAVTVPTYCYNVTSVTDGGNNALRIFAMKYNAYLVGYPIQTSYNLNSGSTVYRICINKPIAEIGNASTETWVLV